MCRFHALLARTFVATKVVAQQPVPQPPPLPVAALQPLVMKQPAAATPKYLLGVAGAFGNGGLQVVEAHNWSPLRAMTIPGVQNVYAVERGDIVLAIRNGLGQFVTPQSPEIFAAIVNTLPKPQTQVFVQCTNCNRQHVYNVTLAANPNWRGQQQAVQQKVVVVLIGDTNDDKIGDVVKAELGAIESSLAEETQKRHLRGKVVRVDGKNCTREGILGALSRVEVLPGDTLLCFMNSHGAHDRTVRDYANGHHFFMTDGKQLLRAELRQALEQKGAALTCLISDSCNTYYKYRITTETSYVVAPRNLKFESLFLGPRGVVDVNSSSEGEVAFGGNFAYHFSDSLKIGTKSQLGSGKAVTWKDYMTDLHGSTNAFYTNVIRKQGLESSDIDASTRQRLKAQLNQTVKIYSLPR